MQKRLHEVFAHVRKHYDIHTQEDFAQYIGYGRTSISAAMNGNEKYLSANLFRSICDKFPGIFNLDYLLTGEGELLAVEEHVAKVAHDDRTSVIKPEPPTPATEVPAELQALLDRALSISRRNEEMVERLVSATSQSRQTEIAIENMAHHLNESQQQVMQIRADILTATDAIHTFRATVDSIRDENERLKASNELLGQRLNKAAALFAELNTKVSHLLDIQSRYPIPIDTTHTASEPDVYPNK
jgi:DNA-binding XRE family transcriptional regulator